ncbi:hypothetical protein [uncultured phage cr60_1]|jgi:hypothetical protein|uniref:Uncharacterized protein n=1 Tax=uncultured phage cr60_1 TaxID=2772082 RepID=A0A7M1RR33_9CAUD|nr:hypothetical protein KNV49_gp02 [uncultured phage cr60_1]QOR56897.1 hypothetical protein [uncultured phage cr60_1]
MKKNLSGKHKDHKGKKLSRTNRTKLRKSKKTEVILSSPGPSPFITKGENGKVIITNISGKVKQKDYTTKIGKNARQENKTARQAKKERIKQILAGMGFEPTVHYTRKEKKKFTRTIKKLLFVQPKPVNLTDEEIKVRFQREKEHKAELLASRPHANEIKASVLEFLKQNKKVLNNKKNTRKFRYIVQNQSEDNPSKDVDFLTDYIEANTKEEALTKVKDIAKKYVNNEKFTGMRIEDTISNDSTYYPKATLAA